MKRKLRKNERILLKEAVRRYFLTYIKKDLNSKFLGLGTEYEYRNLIKLGLMNYSFSINRESYKYDNWFCLTDKGKTLLQKILTVINKNFDKKHITFINIFIEETIDETETTCGKTRIEGTHTDVSPEIEKIIDNVLDTFEIPENFKYK